MTKRPTLGIKVNSVELSRASSRRARSGRMEIADEGERERRQAFLQARASGLADLVAEGEKQAAILRADAAKQARILEEEGEAQAILKVQTALADSIRLLNRQPGGSASHAQGA